MTQETWKRWLAATLVAAVVVGCSKPEEATAPPVEPPVQKTPPAPPVPTTLPTKVPTTPPTVKTQVKPVTPPPATEAAELGKLETGYTADADFGKRVEAIYEISDIGTPAAIRVLGRLFHTEKDPDLKVEMIDSLSDIDGLDDQKLAILTAAAGADQPKDVRESAIDGLGEIAAKFALPILQSLASDPDEDIRDQAKDQIEMLQAEQALQQ